MHARTHVHTHIRTNACLLAPAHSVNRSAGVDDEVENVDLAIEHGLQDNTLGDSIVRGVELGGPATVGNWADFEPAFRRARDAGSNNLVDSCQLMSS